jgi:hypothetical protein
MRLARLAEGPAIDALERALDCGEWPSVVRAAVALIDRAGLADDRLSADDVRALAAAMVAAVTRHADPVTLQAVAAELRKLVPGLAAPRSDEWVM